MSSYPIESTIIQYVQNGDEYVLQIMDLAGNLLEGPYASCLMRVSISSDGTNYDIALGDPGTYPDGKQKVVLSKDESGVLAIGFNVQNRLGLGTVDFRDCGRYHTWYLDEAQSLYIENYPNGDTSVPVLWAGVDEDYVDAAYVYKDTCG